MSLAGSSRVLKRDCTSLSSENLCGACGKSFSVPHILDKHQKYHCDQTRYELRHLSRYAKMHAPTSGSHVQSPPVAKKRRLDNEMSTPPENASMSRLGISKERSSVGSSATVEHDEVIVLHFLPRTAVEAKVP